MRAITLVALASLALLGFAAAQPAPSCNLNAYAGYPGPLELRADLSAATGQPDGSVQDWGWVNSAPAAGTYASLAPESTSAIPDQSVVNNGYYYFALTEGGNISANSFIVGFSYAKRTYSGAPSYNPSSPKKVCFLSLVAPLPESDPNTRFWDLGSSGGVLARNFFIRSGGVRVAQAPSTPKGDCTVAGCVEGAPAFKCSWSWVYENTANPSLVQSFYANPYTLDLTSPENLVKYSEGVKGFEACLEVASPDAAIAFPIVPEINALYCESPGATCQVPGVVPARKAVVPVSICNPTVSAVAPAPPPSPPPPSPNPPSPKPPSPPSPECDPKSILCIIIGIGRRR